MDSRLAAAKDSREKIHGEIKNLEVGLSEVRKDTESLESVFKQLRSVQEQSSQQHREEIERIRQGQTEVLKAIATVTGQLQMINTQMQQTQTQLQRHIEKQAE